MPTSSPRLPDAVAYAGGPRLLGDVGGTNARFALETGPGRIDAIHTLSGADYPEFVLAVEAYLALVGHPALRHAVIAMANPVLGDRISMTNHDWTFSIEATRRHLQLDTLLIVNDFTALSMALPHLKSADLRQAGGGHAQSGAVIGLVGPGTGLGVGALVMDRERPVPLASEGGHVAFAPADEREAAILAWCWRTYPHVSAERLVSGPGMALLYRALSEIRHGAVAEAPATAQIVERALHGGDALSLEVLDCFCGMLGTVVANVALTLGALGGMYIGGGVVPRLGDYFYTSAFRGRFEDKGRFQAYMQNIPTYVIVAQYPAFIGASALLAAHLTTR